MTRPDWRAIIFDFDGVLVESGDIKTRAFVELYGVHGEAVVAEVIKYHVRHGGVSRYEKFRYFQTHLLDKPPLSPEEARELDRRFSERVFEAVIASPAVPGAEQLIRNQSGKTPLFIASGTPEKELKTIVRRRGWTHYFNGIHGSPTPKPDQVAEILRTHSFDPRRVLMIGDSLCDYHSALDNNIAFIGRVRAGSHNPFPPRVRTIDDITESLG